MINNYFNTRKTIRRYCGQEVPDELLNPMLEAAMQAPTTGGMQLYSVVVTRDAEVKRQLHRCHFGQPMVIDAPVVLTICADFNRFVRWCELSGAQPGFGNFLSFTSAMLDATIFAQQFNTIAEMQGLGCCYIGTTTYMAHEIAQVLQLPQLVVPVATLTVGYPADAAAEPKAERLPLEAIVHKEQYHQYTDEQIRQHYAPKEALEVNKGYVAENGKQTLAQVFTDVRYPKESNEAHSALFYRLLEAQGYKLGE